MIHRYHTAVIAASLMMLLGCNGHDHPHPHEDAHHSHEEEPHKSINHTLRTAHTELFLVLDPLVTDQSSGFAAHLTDLENYKPLEKGALKVRLLKDGQQTFEMKDTSPSNPGIYEAEITPDGVGPHELTFIYNGANRSDTFRIREILVYPDETKIPLNGSVEGHDDITFTKEQAWQTDFLVHEVQRDNIHEIIRTSGKVVAPPEKESVVTATSDGLVAFAQPGLQVGSEVIAGQHLFTISSGALLSSNTGEKYRMAEAQLEKTRSNYERAQSLLEDDIIGRKEYEERKMEYEVARARWNTLSKHQGQNGSTISAPASGIITAIHIRPNEFVGEGAPLVEITNTDKVLIHAEVSQKYVNDIPNVSSANFKSSYKDQVYRLEDHNGRLLSFGNALDEHEHFIPVWFELDRPEDLVIGAYLDVYLLAKEKESRIIIPVSALMQDYQMKYVFVQSSGETYEKREVKTGVSDGEHIEVISGLKEGELIVTRGAYQVKMASMSNSIPGHGHSH